MIVACRRVAAALAVCGLVGLVGLVLPPDAASAHVRASEGTSVVRQDGATIRFETSLEYALLAAAAGLGTPPGDDGARTRQLARQHDRLEAYLTDRVVVSIDGVRCASRLAGAEVEHRQDTAYARSVLVHDCPGTPDGAYHLSYGVFSDQDAVVDNHTNIADYQLGGETGAFVFDSTHRELEVGRTGLVASVGRFVAMGVEHILGGYDHVLFLAVLLLGARGLGSVVKVATSFTVAHSVTLALGVLGWVDVPSQIVEPLIALSIAYVAAENILGGESRHRLAVVFGFGLLHGLGFASTLSFTDDLNPRLIGSLVSFNVGIELGQVLLVAVLFPLLSFIRRFAWSSLAHTAATAAAAMLATVWFFQRLLT